MDDGSEVSGSSRWAAVWGVLRPAVPAVIGAAALTFLFAAVMPMGWVAGISWNLYLDRLSDFFLPPIGNAARLIMALSMATIAALIAGFVALIVARPEEAGLGLLRRRARAGDGEEDDVPSRRRADLHPDDLPRAPIRAGRDLPAGGLGPSTGAIVADEVAAEDVGAEELAVEEVAADAADAVAVDPADWPVEDELVLADLAPIEVDEPGTEPWLQPAELAGPVMPDPADNSLGAMVARFEAGLSRRRQTPTATPAIPGAANAAGTGEDVGEEAGEIDFALEAALSTLQRMNRQAIG
ncbi:MAG: hypothetical protein J0H88_16485 [Sphingomonadales bacterium]|nr:hypothetical protein [Sphingomonadales bacterium]